MGGEDMVSTKSERRRQRRIRLQLPVRLDYNDNEALASTKNISLLGTCLDVNKAILPGTRVALSLDIPKYIEDNNLTGEIKGEGAVVRCDPLEEGQQYTNYELGVFFSNFLGSGEEKLSSYLDCMAKKEEKEIREWVTQYRSHIQKRRKEIAKKKRELAKKRAARLAKKAAKNK